MRNPQIQEVLSALGVQAHEVAKWLGWKYEKMIDYMTTPEDVPVEDLKKIAEELDIDISAFFDDRYQMLEGNLK